VLLAALLLLVWPGQPSAQTIFRFPAADPDGLLFLPLIIHVDDSVPPSSEHTVCTDYADEPFPFCYGGHQGSDFLLSDGFAAMDRGVPVLAGADGVVVEVADGNYDRCHTAPPSYDVSCDGHPMVANRVVLQHADGLQSGYWHMRNGSILVKVGDSVRCGQPLGLIGSSGVSAMPHVHFQLQAADGTLIDPYAGPRSQAQSYWVEQVGAFRHPGERCAGEPPPIDQGAAPRDGGAAGPAKASGDGGVSGPAGSPAAPSAAAGCALALDASDRPWPSVAAFALLALLVAITAARRRSSAYRP